MKVLLINGSPRVGGNTSIALGEMEKIFQQEGIQVETVQVGNKAIRGCVACLSCMEKGKCVFDDLVNETASKFAEADALSSPARCITPLPTAPLSPLSTGCFTAPPLTRP